MVQKIKHDFQGKEQKIDPGSETKVPIAIHKTLDTLIKKAKKFDKEK